MQRLSLSLCTSALLVALTAFSHAQQPYPARPIRMLVPFAPGGGTDISARVTGQKMTGAPQQQVIVDKRTGAYGHVAMEIAARAAPTATRSS